MAEPKSDIIPETNRGWTKEERDFCVETYYLSGEKLYAARQAYWLKFYEEKGHLIRLPSIDLIRKWVNIYEQNEKLRKKQKAEEERHQRREASKPSGKLWGRKTGENRIIRTDSIDAGLQKQAIKWKQGDTKWSGPRPVNEKKIVEPIVEEPQYNYYYYEEPEEEVKPDKKQVLKEKFEGKVLELVESLNARGHAARASAFVSLRAELQRHAVHDVLAAHRATLADHVSRALRRGKDAERKAAAAVAPLLAVQVGEEGTEQFVREVRPALTATATDKSATLDTRTECCSSLAVLCYLMEDDITEILEVMRMYETIFSGSYLKDGRANAARVEEGAWHAAALDGWALLLSRLSRNHALSLLNNHAPSFTRLAELLEAQSVEVRLAAGSALAIAYEVATNDDNPDNALTTHVDALLPRLAELAQDSDRFRSKKDLKIQRATFRDILKYFEEGEAPRTSAHIGSSRAVWSSWSGGAAYAALAGALGGALQVLAPRCSRLRAALALNDDILEETESSAEETDQQHTSRKNKKLQREGEAPRTSAHIGSSRAVWSSWSGGAAYAALAGALGGALQVLAPRCSRLRAALALNDDILEETESSAEETDQQHTSRKNKKLQREGEAPRTSAHIGSSRAVWSSWSGGAAYAALAGALGGALQVLAPRCSRLRAALALNDDILEETESSAEETDQQHTSRKNKKLQRHLHNKAASKARDFTRNQNRDKRSTQWRIYP